MEPYLIFVTNARLYSCKFFLAGVNFYRFNAKNWQFTVYFAVITQKIGNLLCILSQFTRFFGVNFILQKFCPCKKIDKYQVCLHEGFPKPGVFLSSLPYLVPQFWIMLNYFLMAKKLENWILTKDQEDVNFSSQIPFSMEIRFWFA